MKQSSMRRHTIDAKEYALGRLASKAAILLMGKEKLDFQRDKDCGDFVEIINCEKVKTTGKKRDEKIYYKHTLYPGHLKKTVMKEVFIKDPTIVVRRAVAKMLPKNKLRTHCLKRLILSR